MPDVAPVYVVLYRWWRHAGSEAVREQACAVGSPDPAASARMHAAVAERLPEIVSDQWVDEEGLRS